MFRMVRHQLRRHKLKLVIGLPIIVLVASSLSLLRTNDEVGLVPEDTPYIEVGQTVTLLVFASTESPINAVGAALTYPEALVEVSSATTDTSIIDLWTELPEYGDGSVRFSGGMVTEHGFIGDGVVATITFRALQPGKARIAFQNASMLAHDGSGTDVLRETHPIVISIRPAESPSPDVNEDRQVNLVDVAVVSSRLFATYEKKYDLNLDGKITLGDLAIVLSNFFDESRLGSFAVKYASR